MTLNQTTSTLISSVVTTDAIVSTIQAYAPAHAQLRQDSREVKCGDVFVAFSGDVHDGRGFVNAAFKAGASCVLVEQEGLNTYFGVTLEAQHSRIIALQNLKQRLGDIASAFYGHPSRQLDCIAVTGTNGKSTVIAYCAQLLQALQNKRAGVVGTLGAGLLGDAPTTGLTTPQASDLQRVLAQCAAQDAGSVSIEASSIGIEEGRLNGVRFNVAAFTNLTQDHLDYHGTMQAYGAAKQRLFDWAGLQAAVIKIDDAFGAQLFTSLSSSDTKRACISTGFSQTAMLSASDLAVQSDASQTFTVHYQGTAYPARINALGAFNVHNALTALGCVVALGYDMAAAIALLPTLDAVAGRMQQVSKSGDSNADTQPLVIVDYAHTPDGLSHALQALQPVAVSRGGVVHVVFGCGGNRDAAKRPLMGAVAKQFAQRITITNDNPRDEAPEQIAAHIAVSAPNATIVLDRAQAIATAIAQAHVNDVILIAGKGHETRQTIGASVLLFSDAIHAQQSLATYGESVIEGGR